MKRTLKLLAVVLVFFMCLLLGKYNNSYGIYRDTLNTKVYISVLDPSATILITLNPNGGTVSGSPISRTPNQEVGSLPIPERAGYNFVGWYTDPTNGTIIEPYTIVDSSITTYYAHWVPVVCKKAQTGTLHTETCDSTGSCKTKAGYSADSTITYGTIPTVNSPKKGDAYDCDVNNDGTYDPLTERFYYIRENTDGVENAVLVHFTGFDEHGQMDNGKTRGSYVYETAQSYLPSTTLWTNPELRTYGTKASRFLQIDDIYAACGGDTVSTVDLTTCQYILENSRFQSKNLGRAGIWIETFSPTSYRIHTETLAISDGVENVAKPVIEIPVEAMDGYKARAIYNITLHLNGGTGTTSATRYEDDEIGSIPSPTKENNRFIGWYYEPDFQTEVDPTDTVTSNIDLYAKWEEVEEAYVFRIPGSCTFNGSSASITSSTNDCISTINPTGENIDYVTSNKKYIDTQVKLYTETDNNKDKDYEIGFTIVEYNPLDNMRQATFVNTKNETDGYPGLVFRRKDATNNLDLSSRKTSSGNETVLIPYSGVQDVKIYRISGEIYYSINGGEKIFVNDLSQYNPSFDLSVWFGATPTNAAATAAQRYLTGTLSNMYIKLEAAGVKHTVTFNANGGQCSTASYEVTHGTEIGELPVPTYPGYYFDGWYTQATGGTQITESTVITDDMPVYAHWKDIFIVEFHGGNGTVSTPSTFQVADGNSVGTANLPTATYTDHYFDGWYTQASGGTKIDGTEAITADTDYYAHYKDYHYVTFNAHGGTVDVVPNPVPVVDGDAIGINNLPTASKEGVAFIGWFTAENGGTQITGVEPITQDVEYHAHYATTCRVYYNGNGGDPDFPYKDIEYNHAIGAFPSVEKFNYILDGWYIDDGTFTTQVTENTTVTGTTNLIAKWVFADYAAAIGNKGYPTIQEAINDVAQNGSTPTTVRVLKDLLNQPVSGSNSALVTIDAGRKVILDLQEHTVSTANSNIKTVLINNGYLEATNGTITTPATQGTIEITSNGTFKSHDVTIGNTGTKAQAIFNNGGTVYIEDGSIITNQTSATGNNRRAAVHNFGNGGKIYITGGTISSVNYNAIYNEKGSLTIGTPGGDVSTTTPTIIGKTYGVMAVAAYDFYDGIIKGETGAVGIGVSSGGYNPPTSEQIDTTKTKIANHETGTQYVDDIDGNYSVLYLGYDTAKYKITLDPRGGQVVGSGIINVEPGDSIGSLPTPTKGVYTFVGWFDLATDQPVNDLTEPTGDMNIYAKWSYTPTHDTFNIINDPMRAYYNNLSTWKSTESTFQTNMDNNFHSYSCLECDGNNANKPYNNCDNPYNGTIQCDKPKGYQTGISETINVYTATSSVNPQTNETEWTKDTLATYVTVTADGTIYDMIPGQTYYWELASDNSIYGTVTVTGERRILEAGNIRNIRDLGGMEVDVDDDGTPDGTLKYGILFRGPKLNSAADVTSLRTLGITEEVDLRGNVSGNKLTENYQPREIVNYEVDKLNYQNNYQDLVDALTTTMTDVKNGEKIYFHCAIGTDRTGTLAWFLEGLLGVSEEDRVQDYELSYFYGLLNRHRFYSQQTGSSITHRFTYMHNLYDTNAKIYNYYTDGNPTQAQTTLIQQFRDAMIDYY